MIMGSDGPPKGGKNVDRRGFFQNLLGEAVLLAEEVQGRPQLRLADLDKLPLDKLQEIMPTLTDGVTILIRDGEVWAQVAGERPTTRRLFDLTPQVKAVIDSFDGQRSIGEIAEALAHETAWPRQQTLEYVRETFLKLVHLGLCVPSNPIY